MASETTRLSDYRKRIDKFDYLDDLEILAFAAEEARIARADERSVCERLMRQQNEAMERMSREVEELSRAQHPEAPRGFVHDGGCSRSCEPAQPASPSKNIVRGLEGMRDLKDGWDTYDGKKPTEAAIAAVESMQAVPVSSGGIQLDWGEFQSVEIGPDGKVVEEQEQSAAPSEAQPDQNRGIYMKYLIERTDGSSAPGGKHERCEYFVLDWEHDKFAVPAARAYADACAREFPELARDLRAMANEHARHIDSAEAQPAAPSPSNAADSSIYDELMDGQRAFPAKVREAEAQPEAPSADVERAIEQLRDLAKDDWNIISDDRTAAQTVLAEMTRLRAENNQLRLNVAAVTEDFKQRTRECDVLRDERDRLRDTTEHCQQCGIAFSERAEMADSGICVECDGKREQDAVELARLRAFADKVRAFCKLASSEAPTGLADALVELDRGKAET